MSDNPPITPTSFRAALPEFSNASVYPDSAINAVIAVALLRFNNPFQFNNMYPVVLNFYVAHSLILGQRAQTAANAGQPPGQAGLVASKSAGGLSVTYDTGATAEKDAGWWNTTLYGQQCWQLIQMAGMSPAVDPGGFPVGNPNIFLGGGFPWV